MDHCLSPRSKSPSNIPDFDPIWSDSAEEENDDYLKIIEETTGNLNENPAADLQTNQWRPEEEEEYSTPLPTGQCQLSQMNPYQMTTDYTDFHEFSGSSVHACVASNVQSNQNHHLLQDNYNALQTLYYSSQHTDMEYDNANHFLHTYQAPMIQDHHYGNNGNVQYAPLNYYNAYQNYHQNYHHDSPMMQEQRIGKTRKEVSRSANGYQKTVRREPRGFHPYQRNGPSSNSQKQRTGLNTTQQYLQIDDVDYIDTIDLISKIAQEIKDHSIHQEVLAEKVMCRTQGTLSEMLSRPKQWHELTTGHQTYLRLHNWLSQPVETRLAILKMTPEDINKVIGPPPPPTCRLFFDSLELLLIYPFFINPKSGEESKKKFVFGNHQKSVLEAVFQQNRNPTTLDKQQLADELKLEYKTVKNFFDNARRRKKH
ncbi:unnamed protein product [Caenorhabditis brenneri]